MKYFLSHTIRKINLFTKKLIIQLIVTGSIYVGETGRWYGGGYRTKNVIGSYCVLHHIVLRDDTLHYPVCCYIVPDIVLYYCIIVLYYRIAQAITSYRMLLYSTR